MCEFVSVFQECNRFLKRKVLASASQYQSKAIPVPVYPPVRVTWPPPSAAHTRRFMQCE